MSRSFRMLCIMIISSFWMLFKIEMAWKYWEILYTESPVTLICSILRKFSSNIKHNARGIYSTIIRNFYAQIISLSFNTMICKLNVFIYDILIINFAQHWNAKEIPQWNSQCNLNLDQRVFCILLNFPPLF